MSFNDFKKVLFILNEKAGENKKGSLKELIISKSEEYGYDCCFYIFSENAEEEIKKAVARQTPEIVVAVGGDGTVNLVASIIKNTSIKLLIIPYGSANGMAKEFELPSKPEDCLSLINKNSIVKKIDLLNINGATSIHLADVGLNARIVRRFQLDKKRGLLTYAKHLFAEVFLIRYKRFYITYDGKTERIKAVSLTFANATKYGTGAVINPDGKLDDGFFEICIVKPFPRIHLLSITIKMFRNRLKYSEYFSVIKCKSAVVRCRKKTLLQIDGELVGKLNEINLQIEPAVLQVIIPEAVNYHSFVN